VKLLVAALLIGVQSVHAQLEQAAAPAAPVRVYGPLRKNEDWSFLKDPAMRKDFWDPIKYVPLRGDDWYLTIGGEVREVLEQAGNDNWGKQPYTNTFLLERYMLHTDWHLGEHFRAFVQLQSGLESFRREGRAQSTKRSSTLKRRFSRWQLREARLDCPASRQAGVELRIRQAHLHS
jgi:hypothetical protein